MRPRIFISAVSKELKSSRQLVSNTLQFLGYEPVCQDIFGTEQGDLRAMLREKIDECQGVVQLVGKCYGAEPPRPDEIFGRVSYTQFEALYARVAGKKVWYLILDASFPTDALHEESAELRELQNAYRQRLQGDVQLFHQLKNQEALEASVLKLRDELTRLRRGFRQWATAVVILLIALVASVFWLKSGQRKQTAQLAEVNSEMSRLRIAVEKYADVQSRIRGESPGQSAEEIQRQTYEELARQAGVKPAFLQENLLQFAAKFKAAANVPAYERANAAYVLRDYAEAERLALLSATEAQRVVPARLAEAAEALKLAGRSAHARGDSRGALSHFQDAIQLVDRATEPLLWADLQREMGNVLMALYRPGDAEQCYEVAFAAARDVPGVNQRALLAIRTERAQALAAAGNYAKAEAEIRSMAKTATEAFGATSAITLILRLGVADSLADQKKYDRAEPEYRETIRLFQETRGPLHESTLGARNHFAAALCAATKFSEAEAELTDLAAIAGPALGPEQRITLSARHNRGVALNGAGKTAQAEAEFQEVLKLREKVFGPDHPETLVTRHGLADLFLAQGNYAAAEMQLRKIVEIESKYLAPEHRKTLQSRHNLTMALAQQKKYDDAVTELRVLIQLRTRILGEGNRDTLASRNNLAQIFSNQKKYAEAEAELRSVIQLQEKHLGPEHRDIITSKANLASAVLNQSRLADAERLYREVVQLSEKILGHADPETLKNRNSLVVALFPQSKFVEADTQCQELVQGWTELVAKRPTDTQLRYQLILSLNSSLSILKRLKGTEERQKAIVASICWHYLLTRDYKDALANADAGRELDAAYLPLEAKRAHALMLLGRTSEAETIYMKYRGRNAGPNQTWEQMLAKDFDEMKAVGVVHSEFSRIRN